MSNDAHYASILNRLTPEQQQLLDEMNADETARSTLVIRTDPSKSNRKACATRNKWKEENRGKS